MSGPEQNLQQVLEDLEEADEVTPLPYTPPGILRGRPPVGSAVVAPAEELHPAQEQQKKRLALHLSSPPPPPHLSSPPDPPLSLLPDARRTKLPRERPFPHGNLLVHVP